MSHLLLLFLVIFSVIAFYWPSMAGVFDQEAVFNGFDPFVESKAWLSQLITLTMFSLGCLLTREELRNVFRRPVSVLGGTAVQYIVMPLTAFLVGKIGGFEGPTLIGIVMVGCVPGAMASNVLTLAAGGNVSYSVSLTTSATLLSPLVVPLVMLATLGPTPEGSSAAIDPVKQSLTLMATVVLPVLLGYGIRELMISLTSKFEPIVSVVGPLIANATIVWIIAVVVGLNRENLAHATLAVAAALLAINLIGYAAGYFSGAAMRIDEPMRRALTLEVGMQNAGLGTFLVLGMFPDEPETAIPTALYTFGCMMTGTLLAQAWAVREKRSLRVAETEREKGD